MATSEEIRTKARELLDKQYEIEQEIQEMQVKLNKARWEKRKVGDEMVELFAKEQFYFLLKVDQKRLRHFIMDNEVTL
jgi:hypothetical protein